jgi:tripartite-type tricarboxylate transporter receptor subunit TctC
MMSRSSQVLQLVAGAAFALWATLAVAADAWPSRPVRLIVPYPPGALTDLLARALAQPLSVSLHQPVIVENKAGAGTLVGAELVARAAPDGYTLLMATSTTLGISPQLYANATIDPVRDFAPVVQVGSVNFFLVCNPAFPARDVRQMIDAIRAAPGKYNYASVGSGSPHHLFMEMLKSELHLDIQHVAYKGTAAAVTDLIAGRVDIMFVDATAAVPNINAHKIVGLATSAAQPTLLMPGIEPVAATVPGFDWQAWQGIVAPAGTPDAILDRLAGELQKIQATTQFNDELFRFGMEPLANKSRAAFAETIQSERPRWAAAIKASGARAE